MTPSVPGGFLRAGLAVSFFIRFVEEGLVEGVVVFPGADAVVRDGVENTTKGIGVLSGSRVPEVEEAV